MRLQQQPAPQINPHPLFFLPHLFRQQRVVLFYYCWPEQDREEVKRATATTNGARTIMLLPPEPDFSVERQIRLGEQVGSAMLVVIADVTDDANIAHLVSSTTDTIFTSSGVTGDDTASSPPSTAAPQTLQAPRPARGRGQEAEERVGGDHPVHDDGREKEALHGDGARDPRSAGQRQSLQKMGGGDEERTGRSRGGLKGNANCPPLTVIIGHDEGKRALEWLLTVGGGSVTARVVEREDVGKLWGDVVWASDPANWPKGARIVCFTPVGM